MFAFPKLQPLAKKSVTLSDFKGLDRRSFAEKDTISESVNMSVHACPYFATRRGRRWMLSLSSGEKITGIFNLDKVYLTSEVNGIPRLYYGNDFSSMSCIFEGIETDVPTSMICKFNNQICIFNLNLSGSETLLVASVTAMDSPTRFTVPIFNDVVVYDNRIFGCRLRQIRSCANGDVSDWNIYSEREDTENRAFYKTFETKSEFTACITYKNQALFFTKDEMYELCGNDSNSYNLVKVAGFGCLNRFSVCELKGVLYFISKEGVVKYNGNKLSVISSALCDRCTNFETALIAAAGDNIYVNYKGKNGRSLYCYNTQNGYWAREDDFNGVCGVGFDGDVYFANSDCVYRLNESYTESLSPNNDGREFNWKMTTQDIYRCDPDKKHGSKIELYAYQPIISIMEVYVSYDGGDFELVSVLDIDGGKAVCIPLRKTDYQRLKIKIIGWGEAEIHYIIQSYLVGGGCK